METKIELEEVNEHGYYEIRLESIGGLGANLCGKLLGELGAVYLGLNASSFSSYGSEKRGSPVKAFIRYSKSDVEIRLHSPVERPHILGLFHQNMIGKMSLMAGVGLGSKVVVNTSFGCAGMRDALKMHAGELFCIDCEKIAMEYKTKTNMIMLGAICKASGFIPFEVLEMLIRDTLGKKYPDLVASNLQGAKQGYDEVISEKFEDDAKYPYIEYKEVENKWGYLNAPIGGVNPHFGSTLSNDLQASRDGYFPLFLIEKCIHCGLCESTCPDMVFQFKPGIYNDKVTMKNTGLDYHHCKGCLRCVDVCPVQALVKGVDREYPHKKHQVRNKDCIVEHLEFEEVGANSIVTSESPLEEERI